MQSLAPALRTDPGNDVEFATMLAEQLRRAPWLALSLAVHAVVLLLFLLLLPAAPLHRDELRVAFAAAPELAVLPPIPPPPLDPVVEPRSDADPQFTDSDVVAADPSPDVVDAAPPVH